MDADNDEPGPDRGQTDEPVAEGDSCLQFLNGQPEIVATALAAPTTLITLHESESAGEHWVAPAEADPGQSSSFSGAEVRVDHRGTWCAIFISSRGGGSSCSSRRR
jgi:hypothetical protein